MYQKLVITWNNVRIKGIYGNLSKMYFFKLEMYFYYLYIKQNYRLKKM